MGLFIPQNIYQEIERLLEERRSGSITLHASDGRIQSFKVEYGGKAVAAPARDTVDKKV